MAEALSPALPRTRAPIAPQPLGALAVPEALLRLQTVVALTGLSRATVYRKLADGEFCTPIHLSARCIRWRAADLKAWLDATGKTA